MRALLNVAPSPEQLALFSRVRSGVEVIRGAAGSGKTTTALLKLRSSIGFFINRKRRQKRTDPITILVLTYNRTLSGYVAELANQQFNDDGEIQLEVSTFSKWAVGALGVPTIIEPKVKSSLLHHLGKSMALSPEFIEEEVDYLMGRFMPQDIAQYLTARRDGRGGTPRMDRPSREALLNNVVHPYIEAKREKNVKDWNGLAVEMATLKFHAYDIVIVDETQDFSANQIRAVMNQLMDPHSVTFILDTVQRIYANGFTWQEVGIAVRPENSFRLQNNYRNTKEIAAFAASLLNDLPTDDDGTVPNFKGATRTGKKPIVLTGLYDQQVAYVLDYIASEIDLDKESVAFLHPKGWFTRLRTLLGGRKLPFVEITRKSEWPTGPENIALSTLHSAKGLEFDHVFILGLNSQVLPHGEGIEDERLTTLRRLLAMGIGRAKTTVILGYKAEDASDVLQFLDPDTFNKIAV